MVYLTLMQEADRRGRERREFTYEDTVNVARQYFMTMARHERKVARRRPADNTDDAASGASTASDDGAGSEYFSDSDTDSEARSDPGSSADVVFDGLGADMRDGFCSKSDTERRPPVTPSGRLVVFVARYPAGHIDLCCGRARELAAETSWPYPTCNDFEKLHLKRASRLQKTANSSFCTQVSRFLPCDYSSKYVLLPTSTCVPCCSVCSPLLGLSHSNSGGGTALLWCVSSVTWVPVSTLPMISAAMMPHTIGAHCDRFG